MRKKKALVKTEGKIYKYVNIELNNS